MFKQTIKFDRIDDAEVFDQHMLDFLRHCETKSRNEDSCLFASSSEVAGIHVRVLKTDSPRMLGRLLNFLSVRNFPPRIL